MVNREMGIKRCEQWERQRKRIGGLVTKRVREKNTQIEREGASKWERENKRDGGGRREKCS